MLETLHLESFQRMYPNVEVIQWNQIFRNMRFHAIKPEMLTDHGIAIPYVCKVNGDSLSDPSMLRIVIFNRDYAISKLASDLKTIRKSMTSSDFEVLMSLVYRHE